MADSPPDPEDHWKSWRPALSLFAVGAVLVASTGGGALLGYWLDTQFETKPWLLVSGILLGLVAGFVQMYRIVKRFLR